MAATFDNTGPGRFRVSGPMTFETITGLLQQSATQLGGSERIEVDLAHVAESDSAGLALLIEWMRLARQRNTSIAYTNVPRQLAALARISEVDEMLGVPPATQRETGTAAAG